MVLILVPERDATPDARGMDIDDMTLAPDLLDTARRLFDPGQLRELNPFVCPPHLHVDPRLEPGTWHAGAPVEGPLLPGQRHPQGPVQPETMPRVLPCGPSPAAETFQRVADAQAKRLALLILGEEMPSKTV